MTQDLTPTLNEPRCFAAYDAGTLCFLPKGHKFVRHCARAGGEIVEWGEPTHKATKHVHEQGSDECDLFNCKIKI